LAKQKKDTPAAGKRARRTGENHLEKTSVRAENKQARREGEKRFYKEQNPACDPKKTNDKCHPHQ
jgi:hypothetical protein